MGVALRHLSIAMLPCCAPGIQKLMKSILIAIHIEIWANFPHKLRHSRTILSTCSNNKDGKGKFILLTHLHVVASSPFAGLNAVSCCFHKSSQITIWKRGNACREKKKLPYLRSGRLQCWLRRNAFWKIKWRPSVAEPTTPRNKTGGP